MQNSPCSVLCLDSLLEAARVSLAVDGVHVLGHPTPSGLPADILQEVGSLSRAEPSEGARWLLCPGQGEPAVALLAWRREEGPVWSDAQRDLLRLFAKTCAEQRDEVHT